jgi:hypothetical protein
VSTNKEACEKLLEHAENISEKYGLKLNKEKCVNLNMNTDLQQTFHDGEKIQKAEDATYLGNVLNLRLTPMQKSARKYRKSIGHSGNTRITGKPRRPARDGSF